MPFTESKHPSLAVYETVYDAEGRQSWRLIDTPCQGSNRIQLNHSDVPPHL